MKRVRGASTRFTWQAGLFDTWVRVGSAGWAHRDTQWPPTPTSRDDNDAEFADDVLILILMLTVGGADTDIYMVYVDHIYSGL